MPNEEILAAIEDLKLATVAILVELERQQSRNFTNSDFLIAEFRTLVRSINNLAEQISGSFK